MRLPSVENLDAVATALTCEPTKYVQLGIEQRVTVMELALKALAAEDIYDMSCDLRIIADWFKHSKLWDGF